MLRLATALFTMFYLWGCATIPLNVSSLGSTKLLDGVHVRQVLLDKQLDGLWESNQQLVCYIEIKDADIEGLSCQNNLGFLVFSGGKRDTKVKGKEMMSSHFVFEKNNPLFSKEKAYFITDLLRIDIFENYQLSPYYFVEKTTVKTTLNDSDGTIVAEVVH